MPRRRSTLMAIPRVVSPIFVLLLFAAATARAQESRVPPPQDEGEVETVETNLTTVLLTATDRKGRLVTTLAREDVRVFEDGAEQRVTVFERQTERPLSLALVFDTSGSQVLSLPEQKSAARLFLRSVFRPARDRAAVVTFASGASLLQPFTNDLSALEAAVERVSLFNSRRAGAQPLAAQPPAPGGGTAVYDALFLTCFKVMRAAPPGTRRAVILLTDGMDNGSRLRARDSVNAAVYADAVVYGIGVGREVDGGALQSVTEETAGRAFFPTDEGRLRAAFARIEQELRSQYLLAYTPTNRAHDGRRRDVRVEIANTEIAKSKVRLSYRQYYYTKKR